MSSESTSIDRRDLQLAALLVAAGVLAQLPTLPFGMPGTKAMNNALRILDGDMPYRDFWTMYAPGHFYLVAGLFALFGVHVWVQTIAAQLLIAIDAALLFAITRRLGLQRRLAVLVGGAFVLMHFGHKEITAYETVLVFLLLAFDRVVCYIQGHGARHLVIAGILCGVGAWFKHDVAFHLAFGMSVGLAGSWLLLSSRRPDRWVSPAGVLVRMGGGAVAAALPMVVFLAWNAGPEAWRDLIVFPATDFSVVRREGYPPVIPDWQQVASWARAPSDVHQIAALATHLSKWVQANVPQIVFVVGVAVVARKRRQLGPDVLALSLLPLATMPAYWVSAHVQQNTNFSTLWILSVILGTIAWVRGRVGPRVRGAMALLLVVATASFTVQVGRGFAEIAYFWPSLATLEFPRVTGVRVPGRTYEFMHPMVSFIRQHVPESEPIYVGLSRHDSVVISNQDFYFVAGRRVASRYNELHPGIVDRDEVQREIIGDLDRLGVRCAVLWTFGWPKSFMDSLLVDRRRQIPQIGSTLLDEYLRREFQEVARYGEYALVWRKGGPIPPPPG